MQEFVKQVKTENEGMKFLLNAKGEISMSDAISHLIEPFREDAPNYNSFSNLVTFACIAWNISILPEEHKERSAR